MFVLFASLFKKSAILEVPSYFYFLIEGHEIKSCSITSCFSSLQCSIETVGISRPPYKPDNYYTFDSSVQCLL